MTRAYSAHRLAPSEGWGWALLAVAWLALAPATWAAVGTTLTLSSPATGSAVAGGTSQLIQWTSDATEPNAVKLQWACNGSGTWNEIVRGQAPSGQYTWTLPRATAAGCSVRGVVLNEDGTESLTAGTRGPFGIDSRAPGSVTDVVVEPSPGRVRLTWTNPPDVDLHSISIFRTENPGSAHVLVATVLATDATNNSFTDTGLTNQTRYFYKLIARDALGNSQDVAVGSAAAQTPPRYASASATDGNVVWVFAGDGTFASPYNDIWAYEPELDLFTRKATTFPEGVMSASADYVGGNLNRVFIFGGWDDNAGALSAIWEYNPASDTLSPAGSLPQGRASGSTEFAPNTGLIYYFGGMDRPFLGDDTVFYDEIFSYNPVTKETLDTGQRLPRASGRMAAVFWPGDGCIYVFGGVDSTHLSSDVIARFNPQTNAVSLLPLRLHAPWSELSAVATPTEILLMGGIVNGSYTRAIFSFTPEGGELAARGETLPRNAAYSVPSGLLNGMIVLVASFPFFEPATRYVPGPGYFAATPGNPPEVPELLSPRDAERYAGAALPVLEARFSDSDPEDTGQLLFQLCGDPGCRGVIASGNSEAGIASGGSGTWQPQDVRAHGTVYWTARSRDSHGRVSAFAAPRSFTLPLPMAGRVGCGCTGPGSVGTFWSLMFVALLARRRRAGRLRV